MFTPPSCKDIGLVNEQRLNCLTDIYNFLVFYSVFNIVETNHQLG